VVVKLGTNDTKPQNWQYKDEFTADYQEMIARFRVLPTKPKIWICLPVPAYPERWGISDERIREELIPLIESVAEDADVRMIDLYQPLSDKPELFPDQVHPNAKGARLMAEEVYKALTGRGDPPSLPKVLIIGDSISMGYFEPTRTLLAGEANIYHNPGNAQHTAYGLAHLDEWLGDTQWDVIHFNHGLHDLKYIDESGKRVDPAVGQQQIPIDQYAENLEALTIRLKKTGFPLVFATTTPVPEGASGRIPGDALHYNRAALEVMAKYGVFVNDLYSFARVQLSAIQNPRDVHFTKAGSQRLAEQVAKSIAKALDK
jgi:acyl-CoA thioesterase-1